MPRLEPVRPLPPAAPDAGPAANGREVAASSVELLRSLRRISRAVGSDLDLESVLQAVVDAVCDHTQWQACWINEINMAQNTAEVAARRDKLAFTTASRKARWDLHISPSLEALRLDAPIAMPHIADFPQYADYVEDARLRGAVAGVVIPFPSLDPTDRPRTLSVQSTMPLLSDERQLQFLRTVTAMAAVAVQNARQVDGGRRELIQTTEAMSLYGFATECLADGRPTSWILTQLEQRSETALLVFDARGAVTHVGRSPASYQTTDAEWEALVRAASSRLAALVVAHGTASPMSAAVALDELLPFPASHRATITRLAGTPSLGALIVVGRDDSASAVHAALGLAISAAAVRDRVRAEAERDLGADVLSSLFSDRTGDDAMLIRQADAFGIDLGEPQALAVLRGPEEASPRLRLAVSAAAASLPGVSVHAFDGAVVVFLPSASDHDARERVGALHRALAPGLRPGVRIAWSGPSRTRGEYPAAWRECVAALDLAGKLGREDPVTLGEFGSYRFLLAGLGEHDIEEHIDRTLGAIIAHDEQGGGLLETIEAFLAAGGRLQETSRQLHIHVSTLRYRLERIRSLTGLDLADDDVRFEMSLAVRLHRLRHPRGHAD